MSAEGGGDLQSVPPVVRRERLKRRVRHRPPCRLPARRSRPASWPALRPVHANPRRRASAQSPQGYPQPLRNPARPRREWPHRPGRCYQLPPRGMTQVHPQPAELQLAAWAGSQVNRPHRHLSGESQRIGRHAAAGHNRLAPQLRERFDHLFNGRETRAKSSFHRSDITPLTDPVKPPASGKPGQRLLNHGPGSQVKQGVCA